MGKRRAETELSKDDVDASSDDSVQTTGTGTWERAPEEELKTRQKVTVARRFTATESTEAPAAMPAFSFGAVATQQSAPAPEVAKAPEPAPAAAQPNILASMFAAQMSSGWECSECLIRNKKEALKCISCESPNPSAPKSAASSSAAPSTSEFTFGAPASAPADGR